MADTGPKEAGVAYAPYCVLTGSSLSSVRPGVPGHFRIVARDGNADPIKRGGDLFVARITGRGAATVRIKDCGNGVYEGSFRLTIGGEFMLTVWLAAVRLPGAGSGGMAVDEFLRSGSQALHAPVQLTNSPARVLCDGGARGSLPILMVEGEGASRATVGEEASFHVRAVQRGRRQLRAFCRIQCRLYRAGQLNKPEGLVAEGRARPLSTRPRLRGSGGVEPDGGRGGGTAEAGWEVVYLPTVAGRFQLLVTADGEPIFGTPYDLHVRPGDRHSSLPFWAPPTQPALTLHSPPPPASR